MATLGAAVGWLAGVYGSAALPRLDLWVGLGLVGVAALVGWLARPAPAGRLAAVMVTFALLGVMRGQADRTSIKPGSIADWAASDVPLVVVGRVVDEPEGDAQAARLRVAVEKVRWGAGGEAPADGDLRVSVPAGASRFGVRAEDLRYGDRVELEGRIERPLDRDDVPLAEVFARQRVAATMRAVAATRLDPVPTDHGLLGWPRAAVDGAFGALYGLKRIGGEALDRRLPAPYAALARGLLLGGIGGMPADLVDAFRRAGLTHLVAVSGYNIAVVAGMLMPLSRLAGGRPGALFWPSAGILAFTLAAGAPASAVRAAIMGCLALVARFVGRPTDAMAGLAVASLLMTAWDPGLIGDLGFLLSSLATLALTVLYPWLDRRLPGQAAADGTAALGGWLLQRLREVVVTTAAVELLTLPLIAVTFGRVAVLSLIANALVLPVVPLGMAVSFAVALTGPLPDVVAAPIGWLAWAPLAWIVAVVEACAAPTWAAPSIGRLGPVLAWMYYGLAGGLVLGLHGRAYRQIAPSPLSMAGRLLDRAPAPLAIGGAFAVALTAWSGALAGPNGAARLTFFEASGATLLRTAGGRAMLFAPGADGRALAADLGRALPFWQQGGVDLVVVPRDAPDATDALPELLRRYRVGQIAVSGADEAPLGRGVAIDPDPRWRQAAAAAGVPIAAPAPDTTLSLDGGGTAWLLVGEAPRSGLGLLLAAGPTRVLLTGDSSADGQRAAAELLDGPVDVLRLSEAGVALDPVLRERADPRLVVARVRPGVPRFAAAPRADERMQVLRSDDHGTVELTLRPTGMEVRSRR